MRQRSIIEGLPGLLLGGVVLAGGLNLAPLARAAAPDGLQARQEAAFLQVCGKCHTADMVRSTPKSADGWQETVQSMVDHGAKGSDAEFNDLMAYLYANLTTINVNTAPAEDLTGILGVPAPVAEAIATRRSARAFTSLDDLKSVAGVDAGRVDSKAKLIFF